jgi:hypothetical protein
MSASLSASAGVRCVEVSSGVAEETRKQEPVERGTWFTEWTWRYSDSPGKATSGGAVGLNEVILCQADESGKIGVREIERIASSLLPDEEILLASR